MAPRHPLVADEAVVPFVEGVPELEGLGRGLEPPAHGIETEVPGAQGDWRRIRILQGSDLAGVSGGDPIDPMVYPHDDAVHHLLLVLVSEARIDLLSDVCLGVPVGVLEVPDVGRSGDEDPSLPDRHSGRPQQLVGKDVAPVQGAVAVGVLQQADHADGLLARTRLVGIVPHLGHVEAAVFIERGRDRVVHERLMGHHLHTESVDRLERCQGLLRLLGRNRLEILGQGRLVPGNVHDLAERIPRVFVNPATQERDQNRSRDETSSRSQTQIGLHTSRLPMSPGPSEGGDSISNQVNRPRGRLSMILPATLRKLPPMILRMSSSE